MHCKKFGVKKTKHSVYFSRIFFSALAGKPVEKYGKSHGAVPSLMGHPCLSFNYNSLFFNFYQLVDVLRQHTPMQGVIMNILWPCLCGAARSAGSEMKNI